MKFSVITPSYNQGRFIRRTIESVLDQNWPDIEYKVFDGGSTDETVDVLTSFGSALQYVSERDKGQTDAVNKGLAWATGDIVAWLNSDDVYYPDAFSAVARIFQEHPEVDVVYGMADHIDINDVAFEAYPSEAWDMARLMDTCYICQPALFFRRSVVERLGPLDETLHYCMDYEYWLRLAKSGVRFHYVEKKLAGSRMYAENKTLGARVKVHAEINDMFRKLFDKVPDRWLYNYAHAVVERRIERSQQPLRFVIEVGARSLLAGVKWNGSISPEMRKQVGEWIFHLG
jgi:glycosyltransferase involved in cell wall biosynthesis